MIFIILAFLQPLHAETVTVKGHVPSALMAKAKDLGRLNRAQKLSLSVTLKLNHETELQQFIHNLHDPSQAAFGKYLSPADFKNTYGASDADVEAVKGYFGGLGMTVLSTAPGRVTLSTDVQTAERALGVEMHNYKTAAGRTVYASTLDPKIESSIAAKIHGLVGLQTFGTIRTHMIPQDSAKTLVAQGSGPGGTLAPADIRSAYSLAGVTQDGTGETVAVLELDGYANSDVQAYTNKFGLPTANLQNILIDGATGTANIKNDQSGVFEANLDIDMLLTVSPKAKILVYEAAGQSEQTIIDLFTKVANDDLATVVSVSLGIPEDEMTGAGIESLNSISEQMAAQGQSVFVASGDSGAYDDGTNLTIDTPASLPYSCAVGGTTVTVNALTKAFASESSWLDTPVKQGQSGAGGGGISSVWAIPDYQAGLGTAANLGGPRGRMTPDVSLHASDATNPYAISAGGQFVGVGGTSAAAPLWAGLMVLVNQKRVAAGLPRVGFANPDLYRVGLSSVSTKNFHDIADGSNNQFYPAVKGYDLSTGLGSYQGSTLINSLSSAVLPPGAPTQLTATVVGP